MQSNVRPQVERGYRRFEHVPEIPRAEKRPPRARERTGIDLSDKTVDLATQHEAKLQAVTRMLEDADRHLSSQPSGDSRSGRSGVRNR
ncbi:hypothetical protein HY622_03275 [Candidatus Uhrbacteria bacterium]|nr:hypothetical protein [Candidatus Uhrbacteria bacterium]